MWIIGSTFVFTFLDFGRSYKGGRRYLHEPSYYINPYPTVIHPVKSYSTISPLQKLHHFSKHLYYIAPTKPAPPYWQNTNPVFKVEGPKKNRYRATDTELLPRRHHGAKPQKYHRRVQYSVMSENQPLFNYPRPEVIKYSSSHKYKNRDNSYNDFHIQNRPEIYGHFQKYREPRHWIPKNTEMAKEKQSNNVIVKTNNGYFLVGSDQKRVSGSDSNQNWNVPISYGKYDMPVKPGKYDTSQAIRRPNVQTMAEQNYWPFPSMDMHMNPRISSNPDYHADILNDISYSETVYGEHKFSGLALPLNITSVPYNHVSFQDQLTTQNETVDDEKVPEAGKVQPLQIKDNKVQDDAQLHALTKTETPHGQRTSKAKSDSKIKNMLQPSIMSRPVNLQAHLLFIKSTQNNSKANVTIESIMSHPTDTYTPIYENKNSKGNIFTSLKPKKPKTFLSSMKVTYNGYSSNVTKSPYYKKRRHHVAGRKVKVAGFRALGPNVSYKRPRYQLLHPKKIRLPRRRFSRQYLDDPNYMHDHWSSEPYLGTPFLPWRHLSYGYETPPPFHPPWNDNKNLDYSDTDCTTGTSSLL